MKDYGVMAAVAIVVVALIAALAWAGVKKNRQWQAFSREHNCQKVAVVKGDVAVGQGVVVGTSGQVGVVTTTEVSPDKTAWRCDDGVTYWR
jgi:hypothetical protein